MWGLYKSDRNLRGSHRNRIENSGRGRCCPRNTYLGSRGAYFEALGIYLGSRGVYLGPRGAYLGPRGAHLEPRVTFLGFLGMFLESRCT